MLSERQCFPMRKYLQKSLKDMKINLLSNLATVLRDSEVV